MTGDTAALVCPECAQGKCQNCTGQLLDAADEWQNCACSHEGRSS